MKKFNYIVFALTVLFNITYSQAPLDSLEKVWLNTDLKAEQRAEALFQFARSQTNLDSALLASYKLYEFSNETNLHHFIVKSLSSMAIVNAQMGNLSLAMENLNKALDHTVLHDLKEEEARIMELISKVWASTGNNSKALPILTDCLKKASTYKDTALLIKCHFAMGTIYGNSNLTDKALESFNKSLVYSKKIKSNTNIIKSKIFLGQTYLNNNDWDSALVYVSESLIFSKKINYDLGIGSSYQALGRIFQSKNNIKIAEFNYLESLKYYSSADDISLVSIDLSNLYLIDSNYVGALEFAQKALEISGDFNKNKMDAYQIIYKIHKLNNNHLKALEMLEMYQTIRDSIFSTENINAISSLELNYEHDKELLRREISYEKSMVIAKVEYQLIIDLVVGLAILIIIFSIVYLRIKSIKINEQKKSLLLQLSVLKNEFCISFSNDQTAKSFNSLGRLERACIEKTIDASLNDTDWSILNKLYAKPAITNAQIADEIFLSVSGVRSSLKKMYVLFGVSEEASNNRRILLVIRAAEISKS